MEYLFLCMAAAGVTLQNFMSKQFNAKAKTINPYFYSAMVAFFAMIFFLITAGGKLCFEKAVLPYSIAFGVMYGVTSFSTVKAMKYGPISITALITSVSLVIPTLYGMIVLNDPIGVLKYIGILLLIVALVLINVKKSENMKFSFKWVVFATASFLGNGFISTLQKIQQMTFDGGYKSEFMIMALAIVFVLFFGLGMGMQGDKKKMLGECMKYAAPAGIANGMVNFLVMVLTAMLPTAVLFPSISAVNMTLTFILALVVFRERLSATQTMGYVAGILSVVLLNM